MVPGAARTPSLRFWRTQRALFREQLAERGEVGVMTIIRGEAGRPLRLDMIGKLTRALEVSPADLKSQLPET
jgi:hypothetical protein